MRMTTYVLAIALGAFIFTAASRAQTDGRNPTSKEEDATIRPFLFVPRARLHDSPIDIKGAGKSVSVVVWAIRESGNHALAGIWHEGTDLNHGGAAKVVAVFNRALSAEELARLSAVGRGCPISSP